MKINPITILEWFAWGFMAVFCIFILIVCFSAVFGLLRFGVSGVV